MVGWTLSLTYCFFLLPLSDCDGKHWHYWTLPYFSFSCDGTHCPERSYCYSYCRTLSCDGKHCQFPTLCLQAILIERCTCTTIPIKVLWSVVWPLPLQGGGGGVVYFSLVHSVLVFSLVQLLLLCASCLPSTTMGGPSNVVDECSGAWRPSIYDIDEGGYWVTNTTKWRWTHCRRGWCWGDWIYRYL